MDKTGSIRQSINDAHESEEESEEEVDDYFGEPIDKQRAPSDF